MINRNLSVVAVIVLLSTTSGCSGMKNFLFGRGAQCGLCNRGGSPLGILPGPAAPYGPGMTSVAPSADCGCNEYVGGGHAGWTGDAMCNGSEPCGNYGVGYSGGEYGYSTSDPYMGGNVVGSSVVPHGGEYIVGEGTVVPGSSVYLPGTGGDNFDARGDRIIRTEPLPGTPRVGQ